MANKKSSPTAGDLRKNYHRPERGALKKMLKRYMDLESKAEPHERVGLGISARAMKKIWLCGHSILPKRTHPSLLDLEFLIINGYLVISPDIRNFRLDSADCVIYGLSEKANLQLASVFSYRKYGVSIIAVGVSILAVVVSIIAIVVSLFHH